MYQMEAADYARQRDEDRRRHIFLDVDMLHAWLAAPIWADDARTRTGAELEFVSETLETVFDGLDSIDRLFGALIDASITANQDAATWQQLKGRGRAATNVLRDLADTVEQRLHASTTTREDHLPDA